MVLRRFSARPWPPAKGGGKFSGGQVIIHPCGTGKNYLLLPGNAKIIVRFGQESQEKECTEKNNRKMPCLPAPARFSG